MAAPNSAAVLLTSLGATQKIAPFTWRMARPGRVTVTFGAPLSLQGQDYVSLAKQVEEAVKTL